MLITPKSMQTHTHTPLPSIPELSRDPSSTLALTHWSTFLLGNTHTHTHTHAQTKIQLTSAKKCLYYPPHDTHTNRILPDTVSLATIVTNKPSGLLGVFY